MTLLKHPTNGRIIDVTGARATVLKQRGYVPATAADLATNVEPPSAVQPQAPLDARPNPPEPSKDARPEELITSPPIDMRPPNPDGPIADSIAAADGSIDASAPGEEDDQGEDQRPAKSAAKDEWVAYAESRGIENADELTKNELIDRLS